MNDPKSVIRPGYVIPDGPAQQTFFDFVWAQHVKYGPPPEADASERRAFVIVPTSPERNGET
jgi:hypothetical protein